MDLAASIQAVTEDVVLRLTRSLATRPGCANLCLAGGVALNCVANGKVLRDGRFDRIWIQPAAGDAGGALGAAFAAYYRENRRADGARSSKSPMRCKGPISARASSKAISNAGWTPQAPFTASSTTMR